MALSAQEHLELIDRVIVKRLNGDAFERYENRERVFFGTPIEKLYDLRDRMEQKVNAANGGNFRLGFDFEM